MKWFDFGALFTPSEKTKLAGIESAATADQTGAEIKAAYEAEVDTNAYDDAAVSKLAGIESAATKYPDTGEQAFLDADHTKLDGIDTGAKDDQTGAEIKTAYEAEANAFTDTKNTKLAGIDTGADVTADNPPQAHGASVHTDRTRKMFISRANPVSTGATHDNGVGLGDAVHETAIYNFKLPEDFVSMVAMKMIFWSMGLTKIAVVDYDVEFGTVGQTATAHNNTDTGNLLSFDLNAYIQVDTMASALYADISKDDYVTAKVTRDGDHASDDLTVDVIVMGIEIEYTADM